MIDLRHVVSSKRNGIAASLEARSSGFGMRPTIRTLDSTMTGVVMVSHWSKS